MEHMKMRMALQILSGRMEYEMFLNEPIEKLGFKRPCCKEEMLAMAESYLYDVFCDIYMRFSE